MAKDPGERRGKEARDADRRERLAQQLRANLQKRKAQARARASHARPPADDEGERGAS
jgi:hypothetical protein